VIAARARRADASGAHGVGQQNQHAFESGEEPEGEGEEEPKRTPSGTRPGVAVNPDQCKNPNPNGLTSRLSECFTCRACRYTTRS